MVESKSAVSAQMRGCFTVPKMVAEPEQHDLEFDESDDEMLKQV